MEECTSSSLFPLVEYGPFFFNNLNLDNKLTDIRIISLDS